MSRMTNDLFEISELAHHGPENLFIAGFTIIGAFTYLIIINWILALICFTMVPILFVVSYFCRRKMRAAFKATRVAQASINASIESSISGIRVTKAYTNENKELEKFEVSNKEFVQARKGTLKPMAVFLIIRQLTITKMELLMYLMLLSLSQVVYSSLKTILL